MNRITIGMFRDIAARTGVDLLCLHLPGVMDRLESDYVWLAKAIGICGGTPGACLAGDELHAGIAQFKQALIDSLPEHKGDGHDEPPPSDYNPWQEVYRAAGAVGIDPSGFTLRELFWMAEGAWKPLMFIAAAVRNSVATKTSDLVQPDELNPYAGNPSRPKTRRRYNATDKLLGK